MKPVRTCLVCRFIVFLSGLLCLALPLSASEGAALFDEGLRHFSESRWEEAQESFEQLVDHEQFAADALFWSGRSLLEQERYEPAIDQFQRLIEEYPEHPDAEEAAYQVGRAFFRKGDREQAIVEFEEFLREFPDSDFAGNALYWSGESLMALGRFDEARVLFEQVVTEHPRSYRAEAARYRMELIELGARERELLELLRWSSEEQLRLSDELRTLREDRRRDVASEDAGTEEPDGERADPGLERRERDRLEELERRERELEERLESVRLREEALELLEDLSL